MKRARHDDWALNAESYRQYVLAELRLAHMRAKLLLVEIDHIGRALGANMIDCDTAMAWLADAKALEFLRPIEPDTMRINPEAEADGLIKTRGREGDTTPRCAPAVTDARPSAD
jgi:hypothetical protein